MSKLILKFLWLEKSVAICLDQKIGDKSTPITEYFFWPQKDAWEDMKNVLENIQWIDPSESIFLLNQITEVINVWQDKDSLQDNKDLCKLREKFPNSLFIGYN